MSLERLDRMDQNLLINGLVKPLCQRAPGSVINLTTAFSYQLIDRFMGRYTGNFNSTPTWEVVGDDSVMTGDFADVSGSLEIQQRIESLLAVSMVGNKVSASMEIFSESCAEVTLSLYYPNAENDFSSETIIESKTFTIPTNQDYLLEWEGVSAGYDVRNGAQFRVKFHSPEVLSASSLHKIKKIKLNVGEKAQEWSPCGKNLIEDRELCQRYYEKSYDVSSIPGNPSSQGRVSIIASNSFERETSAFNMEKVITPVCRVFSTNTGTENRAYSANAGGDVAAVIGDTSTKVVTVHLNNSATNSWGFEWQWTADAEL